MQAIISNNILKMIYAFIFSGGKSWSYLFIGFMVVTLLNTLFVFLL